MSKFIVTGGQKLQGEVRIQGSKNSAFPILAACLLAKGTCQINNVPDISDVKNFLAILEYLGARVEFADHTVTIDTSRVANRDLPQELMSKLRGSIVIVGALLARFGKVRFAYPGGDAIGRRPIDLHLEGFRKLGATVRESDELVEVAAQKLTGARIVLGFTTVTCTENLVLAAVKASGVTEIRLAAAEPHVQALCIFLNLLGAKIEGIGSANLKITGSSRLGQGGFILNSDEIVTMTFCAAAAATRGQVRITGAETSLLDAPLAVLQRMGVDLRTAENEIEIITPAGAYKATKIVTGVYPQLLTDYQPLLGVLATQAEGETLIHDWVYEGRQGYLRALQEMGARIEFDDVHRARIYGPTGLHGIEIKTPDIRAGASILIAALIAKGQSILYNAEIIDRGYEKLDERLNSLGARIERAD